MPVPGSILSLGQDTSTDSTVPTTDPQPAACSGVPVSGQFFSKAPDDSDVESLTGRSDKD